MNLYHGDCLEIMPALPAQSVDAIITDLPYGTTACEWDSIIPLDEMWKQVKRVLKPCGVFVTTASQPFTSALVYSNFEWFKYEWIWEKSMATDYLNAKNKPMKAHENIVVFSSGTTANGSERLMKYYPQKNPRTRKWVKKDLNDGRTGVWDAGNRTPFQKGLVRQSDSDYPRSIIFCSNGNHNNEHPTQKPVSLYEYLIRTYTNPGETVLDIAMGSGTTIVACIQTGRNAIGIEKDKKYYEIAVKRAGKAHPPLFTETATPANNASTRTAGTVSPKLNLFSPEDLPASEGDR